MHLHRFAPALHASAPGRFAPLLLALVALLLAPLAAPSTAHAATLGCADDASGVTDLADWVPEMLAATNAHRAGLGLVALQLDPVLTKASVWKARDLARRDYFDHTDPALGGAPARSPWERLTACGYTGNGARAENIAAGQRSGADFLTAWINSPGHRANIENASMRYVGFGVASSESSRYRTYATQMFSSTPGGTVTPVATPPAAPTVTSLAFAADDPARFVCPPASPAGVAFVEDAVTGTLTVTRTTDGCLRVAPVAGAGAGEATVTYRARGAGGLTSAAVQLRVTISDLPRDVLGGGGGGDGDPGTELPDATGASSFGTSGATVTRSRCRGRLAVAGWCYVLTVRGRLLQADGSAAATRAVVVNRRTATGRYVRAATARTSAQGAFLVRAALRPPSRGTATWLARNATQLRLGATATSTSGGAAQAVRARVTLRR